MGEIPRSRFFNQLIRQRFFFLSEVFSDVSFNARASNPRRNFRYEIAVQIFPIPPSWASRTRKIPGTFQGSFLFSRSQLKLRLVCPQSRKRTGLLKTISVILKTAEWHQIYNMRRDINRLTGLRRTPRIVRSVTQSACKSTTMFYYLSFPRVYSYMEVINSFYGREHWKKEEEEGKKE